MSRNNNILPAITAAIIAGILLLAMCCLHSCKCPCAAIPSGGTTHQEHDSTRTEYIHDSVYIHHWHTEKQKGDTFYIHDSIDRYKDRFVYIHDSIDNSRIDTIYQTIEIEKKGSAFWKGSGIALWVLIGALVLGAIIGLIIKIAK